MSDAIRKAMLLAAGLGTRLRPITLSTPKPLLPLDGATLIDHQLNYLRDNGVTHVMINLHHLGAKIREHVGDGGKYSLFVFYSDEENILGTGGGIKKVEHFFEKKPFIVLNCDALIDADIKKIAATHLENNDDAAMVVKKLSSADDYTPIDVNKKGFVKDFGSGDYYYIGLQILGPKILSYLTESGTPSCIFKDGCIPFIAGGGKIRAHIHSGYANDLGTIERYEAAKKDIKSGLFPTCR